MKSGFGIGDLRAMNLNKMTILLESIMVENQFWFCAWMEKEMKFNWKICSCIACISSSAIHRAVLSSKGNWFNSLQLYVNTFIRPFCYRSKQTASSVVLLVIALVTFARAQFHHPSQFRSQAVVNTGFIPSVHQEDDEKIDDSTPSAAINYRQSAPAYEYEEEEEEQRPTVPNQIRRQQVFQRPHQQPQQQQQQQQTVRQSGPPSKNRFEDELEPEEPDRLALALEKSTFQCEGRTG